ncbi:DUF4365 and DUF1817 domain-containing protein [Burkholderia pseudomallei]|uniref:DUF4365 and DUF1817 domain-containing protein n=1 Tax=Burkholderia pseudomallei TaxID=28450 RepID=UPI0005DEDFDD|nr:DUF4365 and DUF1817 domain-containing protein [Burkholderia pseudomallei]CAJ9625600.1 Uncharacterised protein [Burkholderia pseudomallei]CFT61133.1 Uncharacterised protein [Burkholderia pseudomallei]
MDDGFPYMGKAKKIGEIGVNAVSSIVNDNFGWIFRRNHNEHDFGIDGYIDIVTDGGAVTGQCIAVQIKTGRSFLKTKTEGGFVFYGEKKHLNYYLNLPMPVAVIVHDDIEKITYWQNFSPSRIEGTPTGWKMEIPAINRLERCKSNLLEMVRPAKNHLEALESHWAFNETLSKFDFIHYAVNRDDVEHRDIAPVLDFFRRIESSDALCRKFQGRVELSISGYDADRRELWEIPEVCKWYRKADSSINWFFFCNVRPPAHGFRSYMACLCDTKRLKRRRRTSDGAIRVSLDNEKRIAILSSNFPKLNAMTDRLGLPEEENKRISFAVCDAMDIPHD